MKKEGEKKEESGRQQRKCRLRERSKVDPGKSGQEEVAVRQQVLDVVVGQKIVVDEQEITETSSEKLLGVVVNNTLTWKNMSMCHVDCYTILQVHLYR